MPLHMDDIDRALRQADLFVAIGTSGSVYPAAGFVAEARAAGAETCEINLEAADNASLLRRGPVRTGERDGAGLGRGAHPRAPVSKG